VAAAPAPVPVSPSLPPLERFAGIDRARAERLKRGKLAIEARLDLHGMTQDEAHHAISGFIGGSRASGLRCVLVITGRGAVGGGVLRQAVPRWLDEPGLRRHVLAITPAQPRDGGAGALYILLRRSEAALAAR
jgi:DNA-nicking Smr family endonuclease